MKFYPQFYSTRIRTILFYLILVMPILGGASYAQDYPIKALRIVVPFPPGGSTDLAARIVGEKLSAITKQTVLIENKAGANGAVCVLDFGNNVTSTNTFTVAMPVDTSTSALIRLV